MEFEQIVTVLTTPLVIAIVGIFINKNLAKYRSSLVLNVKLIEKRIEIYDAISVELNEVFQFMTRVGSWKDISPKKLIEKKRNLDQFVHQNKPYWCSDVLSAYTAFMEECFKTNTGTGEDAKIKADIVKYENLDHWAVKYNSMFTGEEADKETIRAKYNQLVGAVSNDFNPPK